MTLPRHNAKQRRICSVHDHQTVVSARLTGLPITEAQPSEEEVNCSDDWRHDIQDFANFGRQLIECERFWQERHTSVEHAVMDHGVSRVARGVEDI